MEQNVQPIEAPVASKKEKSGSGMKVFAVAMTILALAGAGFGVYGMIKSQKSLENSVADLKVQVKNTDGTTTTLETPKIEVKDDNKTLVVSDSAVVMKNPVVTEYELSYGSNRVYDYDSDDNDYFAINIAVKNGVITHCTRIKNDKHYDDMKISGFSGKISSIELVGEGQDDTNAKIIFMMEDGSVEYIKLHDIVKNSSLTVKKANIDGFVIKTVGIGIGQEGGGGYASTIFMLSDGSYVKYNENMFK